MIVKASISKSELSYDSLIRLYSKRTPNIKMTFAASDLILT
jgi:hypothetical protein